MRWCSGMGALKYTTYFGEQYLNQVYKNMEFKNEILNGVTIYSQNVDGQYNNLSDNLMELTLRDPCENLENLPVFLEKLEIIYNQYSYQYPNQHQNMAPNIKIKLPFGCKYVERILSSCY
jgi:hypothetical protein